MSEIMSEFLKSQPRKNKSDSTSINQLLLQDESYLFISALENKNKY